MMHRLATLILFLVLLSFPTIGWSQTIPVVSANGFSCFSSGALVTCKGSFPGHQYPVITAIGSGAAGIIAQYSDHVWSYQSDTGCLCKGSVGTMECSSKGGKKKTFRGADAVAKSGPWCKKGL